MTAAQRCPTCGSPVRVLSSAEGTHAFVPVVTPERLEALEALYTAVRAVGFHVTNACDCRICDVARALAAVAAVPS